MGRTDFDVGLGACGHRNSNKDMIAAASHILYDSFPGATPNPNNNPFATLALHDLYLKTRLTVSCLVVCTGSAVVNSRLRTAASRSSSPSSTGARPAPSSTSTSPRPRSRGSDSPCPPVVFLA